MTRRGIVVRGGLAFVAAVVSLAALCQNPPSEGASAGARALIDKGQYADGLKVAEEAVKGAPSDPALRMCQVDALLGLHRDLEARQVALSNVSLGPGFRFKAGVATAKFGRVADAVEMWKPLYGQKDWAGPAYAESVQSLVAVGSEKQAKLLLAEAMQKVPAPSAELLKLNLMLDMGRESELSALARLKAVDPVNAAKYESLEKLYNAAGGELRQESFEGKLPAVIDLKEKSERNDASTMSWGGPPGSAGGGPGGGNGAATHSSTQGYGAGPKNTSGSEGAKSAPMFAPGRVLVQARINGEKAQPMALDTATSTVLIAPKFAKDLNLQRLGPGEYDGVGLAAPVSTDWVLIKELKVGPLTFKNVPALIIDEKTDYWKDTAGVIPMWMFRHYGIHYDRRHNKLTLLPPGTSPDEALAAGNAQIPTLQIRVLWFGAVPYLETRIQSKPGCYLKVATLTFGTYVEDRRAEDLGVTQRNSGGGIPKERGLFSIYSSAVADNVTLDLGSTRINLPTVLVANLCPDCEVDCSGILGRNILDLFDMYFDYSAGMLSLKGYEKGK